MRFRVKVLILSCNTGGGHNSAATAIKECFDIHGHRCEILDTLALFSKSFSRAISKGHVFVYRHLPRLFGATYRFEEKHNNKVLYYANATTADELYKYISESKFDAVIAVHVFAELTLTEIRKKYAPNIKMYFVATDYTCSPGVSMGDMDAYFIPAGLKDEFISCGVDGEKLVESGIPVRRIFYCRADKKEAKRAEGLDENGKNILMMCGSMGAGPMAELTALLEKNMPSVVGLTVVCGSNKKLYDELSPKYSSSDRIKILGFSDRINALMDSSELMIGKPGGLSTSEAMANRLPMVCINAVPGCETRNIQFLTRKGYVLGADDTEGLATLALELICDDDRLEHMKKLIERDFVGCAAEKIYTHIYEVYEKRDKT